jgi:hypothetical protein
MQMYRVKFARSINDSTVDVGDVILCANTREDAIIAVVQTLALPATETQFECSRLKPNFYQVSRRYVGKSLAAFAAGTVDEHLASSATFPADPKNMTERQRFSLVASAEIMATDEGDAMAALARAIDRQVNRKEQKPSLKYLDIVCERDAQGPRIAAVAANAIFTEHRIFEGGDTRT